MQTDYQRFFTETTLKFLFLSVFLFVSFNSFSQKSVSDQIPFEMRGVWVATVMNIDWPSKPGLGTKIQQEEAIAILERAKSLGFNTIFLQVRPVGDALYHSCKEPWSAFLTGREGKQPEPFYDPLQFWIDQAHQRGLELHAWINPFRASLHFNNSSNPSNAMVKHKDWLVRYGERYYFDPGIPEARDYLMKVVADIVNRYDIDGLHLDDYFYPYPIKDVVFNDDRSFDLYGKGMQRDAWRRQNVDEVIKSLNQTVKQIKPWVKFGVSPFGVWRNIATDPTGSDTTAGVECYDDLHADILLWERQGWIDYVIPQIYWTTNDIPANYIKLLDWWNTVTLNRHLYIGHALYKINASTPFWEIASEMPNQIRLARQRENVTGSVFFSMVHLNRNDLLGFQDSLKFDLYQTPALTPRMPWLGSGRPQPVKNLEVTGRLVRWEAGKSENIENQSKRYIVYLEPANRKARIGGPILFMTGEEHFLLPERHPRDRARYQLSVIAVDRLSNLSIGNPTLRVSF